MRRRGYITTVGTAMALGSAGCLGFGDDAPDDGETDDEETGSGMEAVQHWTPENPVAGDEVTLDARESTGDISEYEWTLSEETLTGETVSMVFETPGEQSVDLTVTGADGETATAAATITVAESLTAAFSREPPEPYAHEVVTFDAGESTGSPETYRWEFGMVERTSDEPTITHAFADAGEMTVTLEVESEGETGQRSQTVEVAISTELNDALSALVEGAETLAELRDTDRAREAADLESVLDTVEDAEAALDRAADEAGREMDIHHFWSVVTAQRELVADHETSLGHFSRLAEGIEAVDEATVDIEEMDDLDSESLNPLTEALVDVSAQVGTHIEERDTLKAVLAEVTPDLVHEGSLEYRGALTEYVRYSNPALSTFDAFVVAYHEFVTAQGELFDGREAFLDQRWEDALTTFESALGRFEDAVSMMEALDLELLSKFEAESPLLIGEADIVGAAEYVPIASTHLEAATAGENSDRGTAEDLFETATEALEGFGF